MGERYLLGVERLASADSLDDGRLDVHASCSGDVSHAIRRPVDTPVLAAAQARLARVRAGVGRPLRYALDESTEEIPLEREWAAMVWAAIAALVQAALHAHGH